MKTIKKITKILSLIILSVVFVGCTVVKPAANTSRRATTTIRDDRPTRPSTNNTRPIEIKAGDDGSNKPILQKTPKKDAPEEEKTDTKSVADNTIQLRSSVRR